MGHDVIERWHRIAKRMSGEALDEILADDVVFHSPVVHSPQQGKALTKLYLMAAFNALPGDGARQERDGEATPAKPDSAFRYVREVVGERDAVLEFTTQIDDIFVNGVDIIRWNDDGQITDFKVMIRPLKAVNKVHAQMAAMLEKMKG